MNHTSLSAESLHIRLGGRPLCQRLDVQIRPGQCWGILGQNGAGKTTLLHTLAGLHLAQGGRILLDEQDLQDLSRRDIARRIGLMPQDTHDDFPATVLETALMGRHPWLSRWQWESRADIQLAEQALATVGLAGFARRPINTLSGGERRRLAFATLLTQSPQYLLLDEPANHLDLRYQQQIFQQLQILARQEHAILMVLHDINHAVHYCDHVLLIFNDGRTRAGKTPALLNEQQLSELYDCPIREYRSGKQRWFAAADPSP